MSDASSVHGSIRSRTRHHGAVALLMALTSTTAFAQRDTSSVIRGSVVDSAGRPIGDVELYVVTSGVTSRTAKNGRFLLRNMHEGPADLRARGLGWIARDTEIILAPGIDTTIVFVMLRAASVLSTVTISASQDDCSPRAREGFECRRRAGIGVFRSAKELDALKPLYWADMFDGIPGLRRYPIRRRRSDGTLEPPDWVVLPAGVGHCLMVLFNGHPPVGTDRYVRVDQIDALEYYDTPSKVPKWYKVFAGHGDCALVVYWTTIRRQ